MNATAFDLSNETDRLVLADVLEERGQTAEARRLRGQQVTEEGAEAVTVGRDGASHDQHGNGIYTTKVYRAVRRQKDGTLTWRLVESLSGHRTAGKKVTASMIGRAMWCAGERGLPYIGGIIHGSMCE